MTISMRTLPRPRTILVTIITVMIATLGLSDIALAHTDFDSSTPSDQQAVQGPLAEVTVNFTNAAVAAGTGFELLDPSGAVRLPSTIDATDGTSFVLSFDPPLTAGTYGIRWKVQAGDAHPIDGSFIFDVTEPTPASVPASTPPADGTTDPNGSLAVGGSAASSASLEELLADGTTNDDAAPVGRTGRTITIMGTIFGVGALAALTWVIRGRRDELHTQLAWIRLAGIVIATGGLLEFASLQAAQSVGISQLLESKAGLAALLKIVGGSIVWLGFHERVGHMTGPAQSLSAAVATELPRSTGASTRIDRAPDEHRWSPTASAVPGLTGYAIILASFWFDGHTVSKGPWAIHSLVNLVHLGAAAVWGGGVFAMTTIAWLRRRRSERAGLAQMVVRFSTVATISLVSVIVAGLAMTVLILDSPGDIVATTWGRILIAKTVAVGIAAAMGAYNHFTLRPALERAPDDARLAAELRATLTAESVVFAVVVVLTAWLVASAT